MVRITTFRPAPDRLVVGVEVTPTPSIFLNAEYRIWSTPADGNIPCVTVPSELPCRPR
jgi:hypothetical protein